MVIKSNVTEVDSSKFPLSHLMTTMFSDLTHVSFGTLMLFILISPELLFLVSSALRGASSKKKKNSLHAAKSASQEVLSTSREEKEQKKKEKKAQSMEHLDGNRKIGTKLTHAHARAHAYTHCLCVCG